MDQMCHAGLDPASSPLGESIKRLDPHQVRGDSGIFKFKAKRKFL